jgi:hypothetical protein
VGRLFNFVCVWMVFSAVCHAVKLDGYRVGDPSGRGEKGIGVDFVVPWPGGVSLGNDFSG